LKRKQEKAVQKRARRSQISPSARKTRDLSRFPVFTYAANRYQHSNGLAPQKSWHIFQELPFLSVKKAVLNIKSSIL